MTDYDRPTDPARPATAGASRVVRSPRRTCRWCAEPTAGGWACRHCTAHHRSAGTADVIVPLTYAIAGTEWSRTLRHYKDHPSRRRRAECATELISVVKSALPQHHQCVSSAVGLPADIVTVIPSLTWRAGVHPFAAVVRDAGTPVSELLVPTASATCHRTVDSAKFVVCDADVVTGRHVLVLDDLWTTGSTAQSAALALRLAGAAAVSIMVVGRWLNPQYLPTKVFLGRHLRNDLIAGCPVTGSGCPVR